MAEEKKKDEITKDMSMMEVLVKHPETQQVFLEHGLHCIGCAAAQFESIEQGAEAHGLDVEKLMIDLNRAVKKENKEK